MLSHERIHFVILLRILNIEDIVVISNMLDEFTRRCKSFKHAMHRFLQHIMRAIDYMFGFDYIAIVNRVVKRSGLNRRQLNDFTVRLGLRMYIQTQRHKKQS
jgi:hypothetical protein